MALDKVTAGVLADEAVTSSKLDTNLQVDGTLGVTGASTLTGNLTVTGDIVPSTPLSHRNHLINGGMQVAQRAVSSDSGDWYNNTGNIYLLDRWYINFETGNTCDITQSTEAPANQLYSIRLDVETVDKKFGIAQIIESKNCVGLYGKDVTLSFKAKVAGSGKLDNVKCAIIEWRSTADVVTKALASAWGAEDTNPTLATNLHYLNTPANLNVTTSWATYSVTATASSGSGCNNFVVFIWSDVSDTDLGDFLYITDVQLEQGSNVTPFERKSFGEELTNCQRYFSKSFSYGTPLVYPVATAIGQCGTVGPSASNNVDHEILHIQDFCVEMRIPPTITLFDMAGTFGKVTTQSGSGRTGVLANEGTKRFRVAAWNGASASGRQLNYHYIAEAEL